jgi:hypothetical protein
MMTSSTIYDHADYANSNIMSQTFISCEWANTNDQCRFSLSLAVSSSVFSVMDSPVSITAYSQPSLNLTSTGISIDDCSNDNTAQNNNSNTGSSNTMDCNCKCIDQSTSHNVSSTNNKAYCVSMPDIRHKPSHSFQISSCVKLNDRKIQHHSNYRNHPTSIL